MSEVMGDSPNSKVVGSSPVGGAFPVAVGSLDRSSYFNNKIHHAKASPLQAGGQRSTSERKPKPKEGSSTIP